MNWESASQTMVYQCRVGSGYLWMDRGAEAWQGKRAIASGQRCLGRVGSKLMVTAEENTHCLRNRADSLSLPVYPLQQLSGWQRTRLVEWYGLAERISSNYLLSKVSQYAPSVVSGYFLLYSLNLPPVNVKIVERAILYLAFSVDVC